jgi:hypothetical protein
MYAKVLNIYQNFTQNSNEDKINHAEVAIFMIKGNDEVQK